MKQIDYQIMWDRLIAVVEEQAMTLVRTAFSTSVREAGDLSAGLFDAEARMMAQAVTGTPGHVNAMAESVGHFAAASARRTRWRATSTSRTIRGWARGTCTTSPS
jgi:N-methylhydantoinase B